MASDDLVRVGGDQVVDHDVAGPLEPPERELSEHPTFVRYRFVEHDVEGADAVGCDEQQVVPQLIDLTDLAAPEQRQVEIDGAERFAHRRSWLLA